MRVRRQIRGSRLGLAVALAAALPAAALAQQAQPVRESVRGWALSIVERQVRAVFDDVDHIEPEQVAGLIAGAPGSVVLLDVREPEEYAVSRIPGAIRVDPEARAAAPIEAGTGPLTDKVVIAYCSVGLRSSRLIVRLGQSLRDRGARRLYNLDGGIFRWRNDQRELVASTGPTRAVHPNNPLWKQLLLEDPAGN